AGRSGEAEGSGAGLSGRAEPGDKQASGGGPAAADGGVVPEDIPPTSGDDIVARQLREVAMSEKDPQLRAKLWNEYRRYKGLAMKPEPTPDAGSEEDQEPEPAPAPAEEPEGDGGEKSSDAGSSPPPRSTT
ncbi:MAG: hypothetical protein DRH76_09745, partial [Deltaproteobacteria bacterium]